MKYILEILTLIVLSIFITGCNDVQPVITDFKYLKQTYPKPKKKPVFRKYEVLILNINGKEFYALQKSEAIKLITDWISYRSWAETNYKLMLSVDGDSNSSTFSKFSTLSRSSKSSTLSRSSRSSK